ncbi:MAG: SDR family NAD(P)-dependent oxidoreductase [bacterium]
MSMLEDRTVMITGASAGIGWACAESFAAAGCRLVLVARRQERLQELIQQITATHAVPILPLALDVRDRVAVEAAVTSLTAEWSEIDVLINNAGLSRGLDRAHEATADDWEEMIDTNIKGLLWMSRAVLPGMVARDRGHLVNIGSISGHQVYPGGSVYCGTKFAVNAITQGMRMDLLGTRVRVSAVDPGMVETDFSLVRFRGEKERADAVYRQFPPLQARDVAETVLFCATRPPHVNINEIIVMPQDQANVYASFARGV